MAVLFDDTYDVPVGFRVETIWLDTGGNAINASVHGHNEYLMDDWLIYTDDPASGVDSEPQDVFAQVQERAPDKWVVQADNQTPLGRWVRVRTENDPNGSGDGRVRVVVETV